MLLLLKNYDGPALVSFNQVLRLGRDYEAQHPGLFDKSVEAGVGTDPAFSAATTRTR